MRAFLTTAGQWVGCGLASVGAGLVAVPLGLIVGGVLMTVLCVAEER